MNKQIFKFKAYVIVMDNVKTYLTEVKDNMNAIATIFKAMQVPE